jgi:dTMP kinase
MYLVLEGIDTAGKSTQMARLKARLSDAVFTKEPGGTPAGVKIREMLLGDGVKSPITELLLFLADRSEHIEEIVKPNRGKTIISDRSLVSGLAYALVKKQFDTAWLLELNRFATEGIMPDHVVILRLSREELGFRLSQKEHDAIESRGADYLMAIQDALMEAVNILGIKHSIIDANSPMDTITKEIEEIIKGES